MVVGRPQIVLRLLYVVETFEDRVDTILNYIDLPNDVIH